MFPRTGSGTFSDAIAKAIDDSWQKHSEHDASVSFRWDVGPTICAKAANWHQPWFMEAHIPHPEPYHQPACAALKNGNHRPFVFGEMREPAKWCWSWIAFWWRHRTHPHAPLWAKRYYAPLRSASKSASTKVAVPPPKKASSFSITSSRNFSRSRSLVTSAMT